MNAVAVPRLWGEKRDVPQFLDGETTGLLSVGRRLLDNPSI
jgi:hypothetical protein